MKKLNRFILLSALLSASTLSHAIPQLIGTETTGGITAINGIDVNGVLYNATFLSGNFNTLYANDSSIVYSPQFASDATQAIFNLFSSAGLLQGSILDFYPYYAFGSSTLYLGGVNMATLWSTGVVGDATRVNIANFNNQQEATDAVDSWAGATLRQKGSLSTAGNYIKWTQAVPETSSLSLLAMGLLAWGIKRRRR